MPQPIFVRSFSDVEQQALDSGLHSSDAFVRRRCQILLASSQGQQVRSIAAQLGCAKQTVRTVIHGFTAYGLAVLTPGSHQPLTAQPIFDAAARERLRFLLHQSPRSFGKSASVWTLPLAAEVSYAEGLTPRLVRGETVRQAVRQLGVSWQRAKQWITNPDPAYLKTTSASS